MQAAAGAAGVAVIVGVPLGTGVNGTVVRFWLYAEKLVPFTPVPNGIVAPGRRVPRGARSAYASWPRPMATMPVRVSWRMP